MSPSTSQHAPGTTASSSSCFALAWHVWSLCLLHVVLVFSSVAVASVFVILLPFACMAASLCLVWAITAQLLSPTSFGEPDQVGVGSIGGDSEVAGSVGDASDREEEEEHGWEAELELSGQQECTAACVDGVQFIEQEPFFSVDTGSYYCYKRFYDLLSFWRRKERTAQGERTA
ncbi:hypothetical protein ACQ4PT_030783 [Festuca glaucescens]